MKKIASAILLGLLLLAGSSQGLAQEPGGNEAPPAQEQPTPQNPVRQWAENRRILIEIGSNNDSTRPQYRYGRHFGHRIGDIIPVEMKIIVLPPMKEGQQEIQLDFNSILNGSLTVERQQDPDFEVVRHTQENGLPGPWVLMATSQQEVQVRRDLKVIATVYTLKLQVRTFRPNKAMPLDIEVLYAAEKRPDGKSWDWKRLPSPSFIVTRSETADNGMDLIEGDSNPQAQPQVLLPYPVMAISFLLLLLPPAILMARALRKLFPPKQRDPEEVAWDTLEPAIAAIRKPTFRKEPYKAILVAIKQYQDADRTAGAPVPAGVRPRPKCEAMTSMEIAMRAAEFFDSDIFVPLVQLLEDEVLINGRQLNDAEKSKLIRDIERLVPRP